MPHMAEHRTAEKRCAGWRLRKDTANGRAEWAADLLSRQAVGGDSVGRSSAAASWLAMLPDAAVPVHRQEAL